MTFDEVYARDRKTREQEKRKKLGHDFFFYFFRSTFRSFLQGKRCPKQKRR